MNRRRPMMSVKGQPRPLRVGIYITAIHCGGVERWAATLAQHFTRCQFVGFLTRYAGNGDTWMPGRTYQISEQHEFFDSCDVILSWFFEEPDVALLSQFKGKLYAVSHGSVEHKWFRDQATFMLRVPGIQPVGVSHAAARAFQRDDILPVIYNGIELDRSIAGPNPDLKKALGFENKKVILYYGRLSSEKRPDLVADLMQFLDPRKYAVVLVGSDTGNYSSKVRRHPGVHLFHPTKSPRSLFSIADCFVNFSATESFCLSLFEALACGIPAVVSRWYVADELEWLLEDTLNTIPLEASTAKAATTVKQVLEQPNPKKIAKLQRRVLTTLSAGCMARAWEDFLGVDPLAEFKRYGDTPSHDDHSYQARC